MLYSIIHIVHFVSTDQPSDCRKADWTYILDSSASVGSAWPDLRQFVADSARKLDIGPDLVHFALVRYGWNYNTEFNLTAHSDAGHVADDILDTAHEMGLTRTDKGIQQARLKVFTTSGDRAGHKNFGKH